MRVSSSTTILWQRGIKDNYIITRFVVTGISALWLLDEQGHLLGTVTCATTSVRRLISPLRRSKGLVACILARCSLGKLI